MTSIPQDSPCYQPSVDDVLASLQEVVWSARAATLDLIYVSPTAVQIYGCSPAQLLSNPQHWLALIHPQDQAPIRRQLAALPPGHPQELTYRLYQSSGMSDSSNGSTPTYRWMSSRVVLQADPELGFRIDGVTRPLGEVPPSLAPSQCCMSESAAHGSKAPNPPGAAALQGCSSSGNEDTTSPNLAEMAHREMETALRQQVQEYAALSRVIQAIRDSLDLETIFMTAVSQITELLRAERVEIIQYLPQRLAWRIVTDYYRNPSNGDLAGCEIDDCNNEVAAQLKRREVIRCSGLPHQPGNETCQKLLTIHPGSWLLVPLQVSNRASDQLEPCIWGCLCLIREATQPWQDADVERVTVVANQLAIAIQQSQLYQRVRQFNAELERQVTRRTGDLRQSLNFEALLKRITDKVRDSLDETYILQTVVRELAESLVLDCCRTGLYDLENQTVTVQHEYRTIDIPPLVGILEPLANRDEVYCQLLAGRCFQFSMWKSHPKRPKYQPTVLCCPIRTRHGTIGDIWLYRPHFITFSGLEMRLVQQIANQCAIAIRQARLYQAAQRQVEELERLNRLKDDFLSTVSHELRTPLANIKMATELLEVVLRQSPTADSRLSQYLTILQNETQQEMTLINDLLDLQHLSAGTQAIEIISISLQDWLPHIAEAFEMRTQQNQQTLTLTIPADLPPIQTDLTGLKRIVMELLNNACKYSPPGAKISIVACLQDEHLHLKVCNTGVEIPKAELARIFDKFYRIPQSDRWRHGGTGLGLALAQQLAMYLGGDILATSRSHITCFTVVLPLTAPHCPTPNPLTLLPQSIAAELD